jgi:hypothetical protein
MTQSSSIFADGVECGSFAAWSSSVTNNGALSANPAAALAGTYGIQANVNSNSAIYVRDDSPASESRYQARFHFDPNSIGMASSNAHYIFYGYTGTTKIVLRVEFRYSTPNYQLRAGLVNNASGWKTSRWINIADAPHLIEVNWQAATASGASDGYLTLWIDDVQRASLTGVANSSRRIDMVRLGAVAGIDTNTRGTYHFDVFESSRQTRVESLGSQTSLPTVAPIAIALDTSEVTLAWQHESAYAEYEVWRNAAPLFDPNDPDSVAVRVANIPAPAAGHSASYGDHTMVSGQSNFYQVIGVTDEGATATLASDVGLIYIALEAN